MFLFQLDLTYPLEEQGPFDLIIHKLSDEITVRAECGDTEAQARLHRFTVSYTCYMYYWFFHMQSSPGARK